MRPLQDRSPRHQASFPLTFHTGQLRIPGNCLNISCSGLLAVFNASLDLWDVGEVNFAFAEGLIGVPARVARLNGHEVGLAFQFKGPQDRDVVALAVQMARSEMSSELGQDTPPF